MSQVSWRAKNLRNDELDLRVPVWPRCMIFRDDAPHSLVVGTNHGDVRFLPLTAIREVLCRHSADCWPAPPIAAPSQTPSLPLPAALVNRHGVLAFHPPLSCRTASGVAPNAPPPLWLSLSLPRYGHTHIVTANDSTPCPAYFQIRVYDTRAQRRPVISAKVGKVPVIALAQTVWACLQFQYSRRVFHS
jgi:hypothetical protein